MSATLGHLGVALANQEQAIETELQRRRQPVTMPANGSKGKLNNTSNSNTPSKKLDAAAARSIVAAKSGSGAAAPDAGDEDGVELRSTEIMHVMCRATGKKIEIAGWRVKIHAARCVVQPCIVCLAHKPNAHVANVQTGRADAASLHVSNRGSCTARTRVCVYVCYVCGVLIRALLARIECMPARHGVQCVHVCMSECCVYTCVCACVRCACVEQASCHPEGHGHDSLVPRYH